MCVKLIFGVTLRMIFRTLDINKNVKNGSIKSKDRVGNRCKFWEYNSLILSISDTFSSFDISHTLLNTFLICATVHVKKRSNIVMILKFLNF